MNNHFAIGIVFTAFMALAVSAAESGPEWKENGDAGSLPNNAQITIGNFPLLTAISGQFTTTARAGEDDFEDMYLIRIIDPLAFRATTDGMDITDAFAEFNSQLWLFRPNPAATDQALGFLGNNDHPNTGNPESLLIPMTDDNTPDLTEAGLYYIAISRFVDDKRNDPVSISGAIFNLALPTEISGPDGLGGNDNIIGWTGDEGNYPGMYKIQLIGAAPAALEPCDCPAGALDEGEEPCGTDNNGGCNSEPPVFTDAECGDTFCGSAWADGGIRDTDWYIVNVNDADGDGVAVINATLISQFAGVCFIVDGIAGCVPVVIGQTGSSIGCINTTVASAEVAAPGTYVVFVANVNFDGNRCGVGNSYTLEITCEGRGNPACNAAAGDCCIANGTPGCKDKECCEAVCAIDPFCCDVEWDDKCVNLSIDIGCAPEAGQPLDLATGPDENADGYLRIGSDSFGSWTDTTFGGLGDTFNPVGATLAQPATFAQAFSIYRQAAGEQEILSTSEDLQGICGEDATMTRTLTAACEPIDTNDDGVDDTRVSSFDVTSDGMDVSFQLTQHVETVTQLGGSLVALVHFDMVITNNAAPVDFELIRHLDLDLTFNGSSFNDDNVGTGTNGVGHKADRFIYQSEAVDGVADPVTSIVISSPDGADYYGGKNGGPVQFPKDPLCPGYGFGTDVQVWEAYGAPDCWANYIVNVGLNTDGDSDTTPGTDGFIGLAIPVSLATEGVTTVSAMLTYGAITPGGGGGVPCPWDLDGNGTVSTADLLALFAAWGPNPGNPADFDGDGFVSTTDLLILFANWGPCL